MWNNSVANYTQSNPGGMRELVSIDEPSEARQEELGVSLVKLSELYNAVDEAERRRAQGGRSFVVMDYVHGETPSVSLAGSKEEIAEPSLSKDFIPTPTVPDDDASRLT